jgi:hypothetical protein
MNNCVEIEIEEGRIKLLEDRLEYHILNDNSIRLLGDFYINSNWSIEKIGKDYILSKSRAILPSDSKDLSNYICILNIKKNKAILKFKLKPFFILSSIFIGIGIITILIFAIYEKSYFQLILFITPFLVYKKLRREKQEFANQVSELIESILR